MQWGLYPSRCILPDEVCSVSKCGRKSSSEPHRDLVHCCFAEFPMSEKPSTTLPGTVEKIIKPLSPDDPEKAQITVEGADHLYREIRIENTLTDENGDQVRLKPGAEVEVTVEAPPEATTPTNPKSDKKD